MDAVGLHPAETMLSKYPYACHVALMEARMGGSVSADSPAR
jgi:hypothetical protein